MTGAAASSSWIPVRTTAGAGIAWKAAATAPRPNGITAQRRRARRNNKKSARMSGFFYLIVLRLVFAAFPTGFASAVGLALTGIFVVFAVPAFFDVFYLGLALIVVFIFVFDFILVFVLVLVLDFGFFH